MTTQFKGAISIALGHALTQIAAAKNRHDLNSIILELEQSLEFQFAYLGIYTIDSIPVRSPFYKRDIPGLGLLDNVLTPELRWAICKQAEVHNRPIDFSTLSLNATEAEIFSSLIEYCKSTQLIFSPFQIRNACGIAGMFFPNKNFDQHAVPVFSILYQIATAISSRFPILLKLPKKTILTPREGQILQLASRGLTEASIANQLGISKNTVRNHMENAKSKLNALNKAHAVGIALRKDEIEPTPIPVPHAVAKKLASSK